MTDYKNNVFTYLACDTDEILTVSTDEAGNIHISTDKVDDFVQLCRNIQEALMLNSYSFEGEKERLAIGIGNGVENYEIILNPNLNDIKS